MTELAILLTQEMLSYCLYEILIKRKVQLDHIAEGLSSLGFTELMGAFTDELQPILVGDVPLFKTRSILQINFRTPGP